jgi:hypothetical protein
VAGVFWMQGESDALDTLVHAEEYGANLTNFITSLRRDLGAADIPFVEGQIGRVFPNADVVRAEQARVATDVAGVRLVSTDSLPRYPGDPYHLTTTAIVELGRRMASAL